MFISETVMCACTCVRGVIGKQQQAAVLDNFDLSVMTSEKKDIWCLSQLLESVSHNKDSVTLHNM